MIWLNNLEKGLEVLCASTKPNSNPDTYSLSVPGINDDTDRKISDRGTEPYDIIYYNKVPALLRG